jgi:hypothetical protein
MVNRLHHRLKTMETHAQRLLTDLHFISVLIYPHDRAEAALENWLAERLRCTCHPDCPGKRVGAVLPKKAPSAEAWSERAQAYYAQRRGSHA